MDKKTLHILVVEDDESLRDALCITLEAAGHKVEAAEHGPRALELIGNGREFNMVVSDLRMDPMDGLQLLTEIRSRKPGLPVLLMTAFGDVDKAVAAMRGGACDFMLKPFEPKDLLAQIERYATPPASEGLVAEDPATRQVLLLAARVAKSEATVLLTGESGVGKEVFARYIHEQSARSNGPFVAINCAAIPDNLLEATLFGHEKGAFTGAQSAQAGKFEQADGGTLLLDEISEMPLALQAKLLRVLQEREVERVGGRKPIPVDIRVLATSNRNMADEVKQGHFREDLFYRINVFPLQIPALRERPGDLVPLARHFLARQGAREGRRVRLSTEAAAIIAAYPWPGNVRELENTMQRALILAPGDTVEPGHLLLSPVAPGTAAAAPATAPAPVFSAAPSYAGLPPIEPNSAPTEASVNMKDLERQHILDTLAKVGGSRKKAVELLGISERTLRYKLAQYREEGFVGNDDERS
ncbi:sigma-54 dependent transcriptional regulator [Denitratisoma sp. agr-D3]